MTAAPSPDPSPPRTEGALGPVSVAELLADAWRESRSGTLQLAHGNQERRILVHEGSPFTAESSDREDDLARSLAESGRISIPDRTRVEKLATERGCAQAAAVLALELVDAPALYRLLRDQARRLLSETLAWESGHYRWTPLAGDPPRSARAFDLPGLLQAELPRRWGSERLFQRLMPDSQSFVEISPRLRRVVARLAEQGPMAERVIRRLDGTVRIGHVLGECAGDPQAAATLWTLLRTGLVRLHDAPVQRELAPRLEFEVLVDDADPKADRRPSSSVRTPAQSDRADRGEAMREEIARLLGRLGEIDHYEALGLEREARPAEIKKAYFKAAKKYHPDALGRLGIADLHDEAARVFARIAEAFETLSDPDRKAHYDSGASASPEIDTARLAQAEKSFRKGEILLRMGQFQAAIEYLEPAVDLWPEEPAYQSGLGWALYKQPRTEAERARLHLQTAHDQAPDDAVILFRLGVVLRSLGETERGNQCVARARSLEPLLDE